ncbi:MAG: Rrf2 family transcriptional regulator [Clostridiales bacterium]|jgi:Rrf2 family protein|nr:Rrf2 family transcriptional regulator [Clostridiales bacterium]
MKLSTKSRYGLRACFVLAQRQEGARLSVAELTQYSGVSQPYLEKILARLADAGVLESARGCEGGYRLAKRPQDVSVGQIVRTLEDNLELTDCLGKGCADAQCPNRRVLRKLYDTINGALDAYSLQDMVNEVL